MPGAVVRGQLRMAHPRTLTVTIGVVVLLVQVWLFYKSDFMSRQHGNLTPPFHPYARDAAPASSVIQHSHHLMGAAWNTKPQGPPQPEHRPSEIRGQMSRRNPHPRKWPFGVISKHDPDGRQNHVPSAKSGSSSSLTEEGGSGQATADRNAVKQRDFHSYLTKHKDRPLVSAGCPDRGVGNHVPSLAFVKVHKSASTTVANILARYALRHTVNVALPRKIPGTERFNYFKSKISQSQVFPIPRNQRYQVVFNHMIFHRNDLQALMPNDTFYFAIMREPLDRFVSSIIYYGYAQLLIQNMRFRSLKEVILYIVNHPQVFRDYTRPELYNSLAWDTGLPPSQHRDVQAIQFHIEKLEKDLDLIMVVEYFDESLVMLKRKACLSMLDIVYMVKNARTSKLQMVVNLTSQQKAQFNQFQLADVLMYDHFFKKFWDRVYSEGTDFFLEVRQFKEIQRTVTDFCSGVVSIWDFVTVPRSAWNEEFVVTSKECRFMRMTELDIQVFLIFRAITLYKMSKHANLPPK